MPYINKQDMIDTLVEANWREDGLGLWAHPDMPNKYDFRTAYEMQETMKDY